MGSIDFKINVQVFTAGFGEEVIEFESIKKKLNVLYEHFPIDSIIIGWGDNKKIYCDAYEYLNSMNTKMLLWFPVFSELEYFKKFQHVVDFRGNEISDYKLKKGESFEFYCPTNSDNLNNIRNIYEAVFGDIPFDGVFLDKIRYPSFANGIRALFSCFCPNCRKEMEKCGIDSERLMHEISVITGESPEFELKNAIRIRQNPNFSYLFENPLWKGFFGFRNNVIHRVVKELYEYFKEKNMIVGLDVFAHSIGYFVGQDMNLLADCGDFIKPMYYRKTMAPAGLPFEMDIFKRVFDLSENCLKSGYGSNKTYPYDLAFDELMNLSEINNKIPIYPGFEINRNESISPIYPLYVKESLELVKKSNLNGVVLSWDLNNAPEDNLAAVCDFFKKEAG